MEINNISINYFLKKIIDDDDVSVFEKYINLMIKENIIDSFDDIEIDNKSVVEYICINKKSEFLKKLFKYNMNLNNSFSNNLPSLLSAKYNDLKSLDIFIKDKNALLANNKSSIFIELAKNDSLKYINKLLNLEKFNNLLKFEDEKSNNFLFYINDLNLIRKVIKINKKLLNTLNWNNDDLVIHFAKEKNYKITTFFIKNNFYKLQNINYQDCNIIHYILKNKWFDLLDLISVKKIKKEYNICNIEGNDLFLELLINSVDDYYEKYNKIFFNKNLIDYYIEKVSVLDDDYIRRFIKYDLKNLNNNQIINFFVLLLEEKNEIIAIQLLELCQLDRSKELLYLLKGILDKYLNSYINILNKKSDI